MLHTIDEALDYIYSFTNLEKRRESKFSGKKEYSLENIDKIIKYFDSPHKEMKIFHIAGTKGKGSVSYFIAKLLNLAGNSVSNFLSPHLVAPNERFLYDLCPLSDNDMIELANYIKKVLDENNLKPTTFEFFFILFLLYSKQVKSDYAIIEAGLGGRLDCTNIVNPLVSVITPIGLDHTDILGNTKPAIAKEKAGIIKQNRPVVIGKQVSACKRVMKKEAFLRDAPFNDVEKYFKLLSFKPVENGIIFDFSFNGIIIKDFFISVFGKHQIYNFFTALLAVYLINPEIISIIKRAGKVELQISGRIELLQKSFPVVLDVAHNIDSAKRLKETLFLHFPKTKWNILSGMSADKEYAGFYKELKKIARKIIVTTPSKYKFSDTNEVFSKAKKYIKNAVLESDFEKAVDMALLEEHPLLVTGSFYIAGPFLEKWEKRG